MVVRFGKGSYRVNVHGLSIKDLSAFEKQLRSITSCTLTASGSSLNNRWNLTKVELKKASFLALTLRNLRVLIFLLLTVGSMFLSISKILCRHFATYIISKYVMRFISLQDFKRIRRLS